MAGSPVRGSYVPRRKRLLKDFDKNLGKYGRGIFVARYGEAFARDALEEMHREFDSLIPQLPDVGGKMNLMERDLLQSIWALSVYKVLQRHGKTAEETGRIAYEFVEAKVRSYPRWFRRLYGRWRFTQHSVRKLIRHADESQARRYPGDWVWKAAQGDGEDFDFSTEMTECAVCKFFHSQGADEFTPYMCATDFAVSEGFNLGLVRTKTLADGDDRCDFRYKRGRKTSPAPRNPQGSVPVR